MVQKIGVLFAHAFILILFIFMTRDFYHQFLVSKYGVIVDAIVVDRNCPGKNSYIRVTYNNKIYSLWVSFSNCINDFPDGSKVKAKYLDGYSLRFAGAYSVTEVIAIEVIGLIFLIMSIVSIYQVFFPKKLPEEN